MDNVFTLVLSLSLLGLPARGGPVHLQGLPHLLRQEEDPDRPHGEGQGHAALRDPVMVIGLETRTRALWDDHAAVWDVD